MTRNIVWLSLPLMMATTTPGVSAQQVTPDDHDRAVVAGLRTAQALLNQPVTLALDHVSLAQALHAVALQTNVSVHYQTEMINTGEHSVTLHVTNVSLGRVFDQLFAGTRLRVVPTPDGRLAVIETRGVTTAGVITGHVRDVKTKRPLAGASLTLDGATKGITTSEDGAYRFVGVSAGAHAITAKYIGYSRQTRQTVLPDEETLTLDIGLEPSASVLDQVVVTGTVVQTELKAVPNAITVITAKDIEQRGITKIDQLFRGDVPGLFAQNRGSDPNALLDEVTMFSRGASALETGTSLGITNPIKTYVDGIELADPKYLSQIDPKSIERIEILTGPQASTIYGSNAINGVMQIFTKRGTTSSPQLTLNLLSGWVENNFSSAHTPQHDYNAQLSGLEGRFSYNAGGSWNYMGPWTPAKQLARTDGFGGARLELPTPDGRVTADVTLRRSSTQSLQRGDVFQKQTGYRETGWWINSSSSGLAVPTTRTLAGQTLGVTLSYAPAPWWSHELGLGQDASDAERRVTARGYASVADTTLYVRQDHTDRRSLRYATTARLALASLAQLTVSAGADAWQNLTSYMEVFPQTLTGPLTGSTDVSRQPGHNTGGFLQTQLGLREKLFFTYGLRAEWNPNYGADAQPNMAPRYGVAYTQDIATPFGPLTAKLRGSYGRSTRPPQPGLKIAQTIADLYGSDWSSISSYFLPYYGSIFDFSLANPALGPEHQQGGEGGLELYLGTHGSLVVTRYNQTVDGLIASTTVDSVRSLVVCSSAPCFADSYDADGYGYERQYEYLNIGSIRNQGWELQSSVTLGPLTTHGTYSWTKSRTIGVNPKYRAYFADQPQYQPGATFQYLPEHTWALGTTYARGASSVGLNVTESRRATNLLDDFYLQHFNSSIRLPQNRLNISNIGRYIKFNAGYALADLTASHRFASRIEGVLQVQNLADRYTNDFNAQYASLGRQTKLGIRVRTP